MGTVLYEVAWEFDSGMMVPFFMVTAGMIAWKKKPFKGFERALMLVFLSISTFVSLFVIAEQIDQYHKIVAAYRDGNYQIVEGYVEHFHTIPPTGHDTERFEVNGVLFEYSDAMLMQGYHTSLRNGGVITGDGQHLRIGYIIMDSATGNRMLDRVIVYIEELPTDTQ